MAGSPQLPMLASDDFPWFTTASMGVKRVTTGRLVPFCLFTDPEFARVGLSEKDAKAKEFPIGCLASRWKRSCARTTMSENTRIPQALVEVDKISSLAHWFGCGRGRGLCLPCRLRWWQDCLITALRDAMLTHPTLVEGLIPLFSSVPWVSKSGRRNG